MRAVEGDSLDPAVMALAQGSNFGAVATMMPGGGIQNHVVWVGTDGVHLQVNTPSGTQKHRNVIRDPRITVTIWDAINPFHYAEVRGEVTAVKEGDAAWAHINALSDKYAGVGYFAPRHERVIIEVTPLRQLISGPPSFPP